MPTADGKWLFLEEVVFGDGFKPPMSRANLVQDTLMPYTVSWTAWRIWNDINSPLTGTPNTDDLGLVGPWSLAPSIRTSDFKGAGASIQYARAHIVLPAEYVAGQTVVLRFHAGMLTTEADTAATLGLHVRRSDEELGWGAELSGGSLSINSLTLADKDFTIEPATLSPGDLLDVRLAITINDAATPTAVKGVLGAIKLLCDVKG